MIPRLQRPRLFKPRKDLAASRRRGGTSMSNKQSLVEQSLSSKVDDLLSHVGVWRLLGVVMLVVLKRRERVNSTRHLSNRMRRDMGLPEERERLPLPRHPLWMVKW